MPNYIISACSTADLSKKHFEDRDIKYVCFHYELDGKNYADDFGTTIPLKDFYAAMENGSDTKTSQVNLNEYLVFFEGFLKQGLDIVHIAFSSGLSGSYNSACGAASILREKYPDRRIFVIDSLCASSGFGLLIDKAADLRDEGMSASDLNDWLEAHKQELQHWFFTTTLKFFVKGGRVSKAAGFFGGVLNICPLLHVDHEGHLIPMEKIRSKKKVIIATVDKMQELAKDGLDYSGKCYISNSACYDDAKAVADLIEQRFPKLNGPVEINDIGTVIGSHTGPGTVALFFWGKPRNEE